MTERTIKRKVIPIDFGKVPEDIDPWFTLSINRKKWEEYMNAVMPVDIKLSESGPDTFTVSVFGGEVSFVIKSACKVGNILCEDGSYIPNTKKHLEFTHMLIHNEGKDYSFLKANCKFSRSHSTFGMVLWVRYLLDLAGIEELGGVWCETLTRGYFGTLDPRKG